ncbi:hypothetical protein LTR86_008085 [Recurvomyces mirabilis]|nr:hypothetical protein LTR86_008085 [Recurvomyces mirabilis]
MAGNSSNIQANTKCIHNIAIDPLDENYFASSAGYGDPSYSVWDRRWMSQQSFAGSTNGAVLSCRMPSMTGSPVLIRNLQWSGRTRGRLAISSNAGDIKVIDIRQSKPASTIDGLSQPPNNPYGGSQWRDKHYVSHTRLVSSPWHNAAPTGQSELIGFDWISGPVEEQTQRMILLSGSHYVTTVKVPDNYTQVHLSGQHNILISARSLRISDMRGDSGEEVDPLSQPHVPSLSQLLIDSSISETRCRGGYLFDCDKNIQIVAADIRLERLWRIIRRFRSQARSDGMVCGSLDLSYIGVAAIWAEDIATDGRRYTQGSPIAVAEAIAGLISSRSIPQFEGARTSFPEHRQLCLALCGWKFTIETLEEECQELIESGQYYLAIVQAVLHGYKHIALNLLRSLIRSKTIPNIGLGALLASTEINEEQHEMCLWMEADAEDPALKALLTYLTTGDWRTVMKTTYLDSDYRIALGLKYLNDTELSGFLQGETARAIRNGDLEGLLLTGLTEPAMGLLQTYITKTGDVQTAVLASAYANPRYVDDMRWDVWKETYFEHMQTWRAFHERARFTVQHNALSVDHDGRSYKQSPVMESLDFLLLDKVVLHACNVDDIYRAALFAACG